MKPEKIEIRWHGRGGQGAITAAKIVAHTGFESGYKGIVMAPTFGTERRGAPIFTSLKISRQKIYDLSPIDTPDMVVVLDHTLLEEVDVAAGLKPGGLMIINTPRPAEEYHFAGMKVAVADVTHLAQEAGLPSGVVNSGIIGAFSKATGLLDIDDLVREIENEFKDKKPEKNAAAARLVYEKTRLGGAL
ncbi:MAG: 2-oxoacid:acceptor oxidoreductase family protein [Proteobacteria bacterium]|nr:2-oxoacid:acceptor oxidoreductase family protein [Pseudomonadota bacterium]MBU1388571.1 2-oxoacid:acceptor oxidoreductase family protein [Pseudomonadota bacterium]MBU1541395.1 2-oxoacid:acceptor oxidoreductase family protein [Pseudomonadota bacterium]MBU2480922.1 2-oxoacid:acceptor oxidoreductase family protein [Pseudomonadota bacterium]